MMLAIGLLSSPFKLNIVMVLSKRPHGFCPKSVMPSGLYCLLFIPTRLSVVPTPSLAGFKLFRASLATFTICGIRIVLQYSVSISPQPEIPLALGPE